MTSDNYTKLLVGKHSPKNKCYVSDGDVLYVTPRLNLPQKSHVAHHFVSSTDQSKTSQYGCVAEVSPFSLDTFLSDRLGGSVDDETIQHVPAMLRAIAKLDPGTPVAATYGRRGVEESRMELSIHRVFFHSE